MVSQTCMVEAPPPRTPELSVLGLKPEVVYSRPGGAEQTQLTRLTPNMEERMQAIQVSVRALLLLQPDITVARYLRTFAHRGTYT